MGEKDRYTEWPSGDNNPGQVPDDRADDREVQNRHFDLPCAKPMAGRNHDDQE
jgi:hypothetical protein